MVKTRGLNTDKANRTAASNWLDAKQSCFLPLSFVVSHAYIFNKYQNTVLFTFWKEALAAPFCLFRLESAAIHKKCSDWLKFPSRCPAGDWTWTVSKPLHNPTAAHMFNFRTPLRCSNGDRQEIEYILCPNLVQPNVLRTGSISEFPFHCAPTNLMFWWAIMRYCHTNTISYIILRDGHGQKQHSFGQ